MEQKKLRIGWFSFSCCEDSAIMFAEILNDHYKEWFPLLDVVYSKIFKSRNEILPMDVAFVEGAIASDEQAAKLKKIRENAKKLVAVGACAVVGMPAGQRNMFDETTKKEIQPILDRFDYKEKVQRVDEVVTVDEKVPGCPMDEKLFVALMERFLSS